MNLKIYFSYLKEKSVYISVGFGGPCGRTLCRNGINCLNIIQEGRRKRYSRRYGRYRGDNSRTFAHRTLAHDRYFIDECQVHRPFYDFIFPALFSRVNGLFFHIKFIVLFYSIFFLGRLSLLSCIITCNPTFYYLKS